MPDLNVTSIGVELWGRAKGAIVSSEFYSASLCHLEVFT